MKEDRLAAVVKRRLYHVDIVTLHQSSMFYSKDEMDYANGSRQDKASQDIMESLSRIEHVVNNLSGRIENISGDMIQIKSDHNRLMLQIPNFSHSEGSLKEEVHDAVQMPQASYSIPSVGTESQVPPSNESPYGSTPGQRVRESAEPFHPPQDSSEPFHPPQDDDDEEEEVAGGNPKPTKEPSIPVNHTTGAARLLLVAPIREMCKKVMDSSKIRSEKYPIVQEGKRGLLRVYGRGEGQDYTPGYHQEFHDYQSEGTPGDSHSDVSSPSGEEWGQCGGLTPPGNPPGYPPLEITRGGISSEGMPDFSRETVFELVRSYNKNINNMHQLLIPRHLDTMVEHFLKSLPEGQARARQLSSLVGGHAPAAGFVGAGGYRNPESPGNKRKRSPGTADYPDVPSMLEYKPGHPFRSISTALVLLVLALGKICQVEGKISDVYTSSETESDGSFSSSPTVRNGHPPSPVLNSPSMAAMGIMSPKEQPRSRRASVEGAFQSRSNASKPRNLDVIPGLAYFALATDIIGNQLAGNTLQHVHANILAGLYHGQLARVMESYAYIHAACRALQVILRP